MVTEVEDVPVEDMKSASVELSADYVAELFSDAEGALPPRDSEDGIDIDIDIDALFGDPDFGGMQEDDPAPREPTKDRPSTHEVGRVADELNPWLMDDIDLSAFDGSDEGGGMKP